MLGKYLEHDGPISIGGHRGAGMNAEILYREGDNYAIHDGFKYRENTIKSLKAASKAGASFVEFDIQVTKDNVPVCWHDDEVVLDQPFQRFKVQDVDYAQLSSVAETCMDPKSSSKSHMQALSHDLSNSSYALFQMGKIDEEGPPQDPTSPPLRKEGSGGGLSKDGSRKLSRNVSLKKGSYLVRKFVTVEIEYQGPNILINQVNP